MNEVVHIEGLADLEKALLDLAPKEAKKALSQALRKAGAIVQKDAQQLVPKDTGLLEKALKIRTKAGVFSGLLGSAQLGPLKISLTEGRQTDKGFLIVKVGLYKPSKVAGSHKKYPGDPFYARFVEFGTRFMPARPFLRPALERNRDRIINIFKSELAANINKLNNRSN